MNNFFGIGTSDSFYDKRRHINLVYYTMVFLKTLKRENDYIMNLRRVLTPGYSKQEKANMVCNGILNKYEVSYLNYLKTRYHLSEDDYLTILAGETLSQQEVRTPAGYQSTQNWELLIQTMYATMLSGASYQHLVQQFIEGFLAPLAADMRGVTIRASTFRLMGENINKCLNDGKRLFSDLPYIEKYVIDRIQ